LRLQPNKKVKLAGRRRHQTDAGESSGDVEIKALVGLQLTFNALCRYRLRGGERTNIQKIRTFVSRPAP
jgi:hypothetical protein